MPMPMPMPMPGCRYVDFQSLCLGVRRVAVGRQSYRVGGAAWDLGSGGRCGAGVQDGTGKDVSQWHECITLLSRKK